MSGKKQEVQESLLDVIKPVLIFGQIFSLTPVSFKNLPSLNKYVLVWGVFLLVSYVGLFVAQIYESKAKTLFINDTVNKMQMACYVCTMLANLVFSWRSFGQIGEFVEKLQMFDLTAKRAGVQIDRKNTKIFQIFTILGASVVLAYVGIFDYYVQVSLKRLMMPLRWTVTYSSVFLNTVTTTQLMVFCFIIYQSYKSLNFYIENITKWSYQHKQGQVKKSGDQKSPVKANIFDHHQNISMFLDGVRNINDCLSSACKSLDSSYSIQNLFRLGAGFIIVTVQLYYMLATKMSTVMYVCLVNWIGLHVLHILIVVIGFQYIKLQIDSVPSNLYKITLDNHALNQELNLTGIYLHTTRIEFSAFHIFRIDASVLLSMVSAAVTYIVILIQFSHFDEKSGSNTHAFRADGPAL